MPNIKNSITGDIVSYESTYDYNYIGKLYNHYAEVTLGSHIFQCPPFNMEFEQTYSIKVPWLVKLKLYNPSKTTIDNCIKNKEIQIDAGYLPFKYENTGYGTCVKGKIDYSEINKPKFEQSKTDTVLEISILDSITTTLYKPLKNSYRNQLLSSILDQILEEVGITLPIGQMQLGKDLLLKTFVPGIFKNALDRLCILSESSWSFNNGQIEIKPANKTVVNKIIELSPKSGLIETVKKYYDKDLAAKYTGKDLIKFKSLFFPSLKLYSNVMIKDGSGNKKQYMIVGGRKYFATHKSSYCEWEAVSI